MKNKFIHVLILLLLTFLFGIMFNNKVLVYGDFATAFFYNKNSFLSTLNYAWLDNSFLGYVHLLYSIIRMPYYISSDFINAIFGYQNWWFIFVFIYFLRYYFLYRLFIYFNVRPYISILVSLIYTLNFYFIDRLGHIYISFASITIPLLIISYLELIKKISIKYLSLFLFSLWIIFTSMHVTLMTLYFSSILFVLELRASFLQRNIKNFLKNNIIILVISFFAFSYILIPYIDQLFFSETPSVIAVSGDISSEAIYTYSRSTILPLPFIGLGFYASELQQNIFILFGALIILISIILLVFFQENKNIINLFFSLIFLIFSFLSSISLMREYVPILKSYLVGFNSIKDSGYFILYVVISLFILLGLSLNKIEKKYGKYVKFYLICLLIFFLFVNIFALSSFKVFQKSEIPSSYYDISRYIEKDERTLILPLGWISVFEWSNNEIMSGFFNLFFADHEIVGQSIIEGPTILTQNKIDTFNQCFINNCQNLINEIKDLNLKYIINFKGAKDITYKYNLDYSSAINFLLINEYIKKIFENNDYVIYTFSNNSILDPRIQSPNLYFKKINPTKYRLYIKNIKYQQSLNFADSFHNDWHLYLKSNPTDDWCESQYFYQNINTTKCKREEKMFQGDELNYLFGESIFDNTHRVVNEYSNGWTIDPEYIKANYPQQYYRRYADGSIDIELILYFKPQSYYYLGLVISMLAFLGCFGYLTWTYRRKRDR